MKFLDVATDSGNESRSATDSARFSSSVRPTSPFGILSRRAPLGILSKTILDPLLVALGFYLSAFAFEGGIRGNVFVAGILAALLARYVVDGSTLFLRERSLIKDLALFLVGWVALVAAMYYISSISGVRHAISNSIFQSWALYTPIAIILAHRLVKLFISHNFWPLSRNHTAIIVGASSKAGRALARAIISDRSFNLMFLGYFDDRSCDRSNSSECEPIGLIEDVADYVARNHVHSIYITLPMTSHPRVMSLIDSLKNTTASVYFVPDFLSFDLIQARFDHLAGIPLVSVCESPFEGAPGLLKRGSDLCIASAASVLLFPLICLISALVKLTSPGPIIFKQRRYGLDGKDMIIYKFRTMTVQEDGVEIKQARQNDKRLTPIGGFLRKSSLDELPQFINVLQGRMSVVGPRPHAAAHNEEYRHLIKGYMLRHKVRPGMTGWAQVNGCRGETDTLDKMEARIKYDLEYLRKWSVFLDLTIILKTTALIFTDRNAY